MRFFHSWWATARTSFFWMVLIALLLRLCLIFFGQTYKFYAHDHNFSFGYEMGSIGRSLAAGEGFSSPFGERTGPTAWEPPLYPFLIAGVFKVFGIYTRTSAIVLLVINSVFSALTCIPIFLIGRRCFSEKVAVWTAWLWALLPSVAYWATRWVWETSLAALLLTIIFWLALLMEELDGWRGWGWFGVLWGIAALTNTSLLAFLPASGLWICYQRWKRRKAFLAGVVLSSVVFFACLAPWIVRNCRVFGKFIFIRSNFGAELSIGNNPLANGTWLVYLHPTQNTVEMNRYKQLGEMAYVASCKQKALAYIRADYGRFAGLCVKRFIYYWGGVPRIAEIAWQAPFKNSVFLASSVLALWGLGRALRRKIPGAWLFLWLILCYPAVYYAVFPHPRYRHPIEPELGILIIYVISEAKKGKSPHE